MKTLITWATANPALALVWSIFATVIFSAIVKGIITATTTSKAPIVPVTPANPNIQPANNNNGVNIIMRVARGGAPSGIGGNGMSGARVNHNAQGR